MPKTELFLIHERLQGLVGALGWDQARLAREALVNPSTISRWINGKEVGKASIERIAQATGCSVDWLKTGEGKMFGTAKKCVLPAPIDPGNQETSEILEVYRKVTERNVHLRQIVEWLDAEFGQKDEQALFFYEDLKDRYPTFAEFMQKKRPTGSGLATEIQNEKL
jgi:transcriptional regulator with XRE-family HTH domain